MNAKWTASSLETFYLRGSQNSGGMLVLLCIDCECHYADRELYNFNTVNWEPGEPYVRNRKRCEFVPSIQFSDSYNDVAIQSIHTARTRIQKIIIFNPFSWP